MKRIILASCCFLVTFTIGISLIWLLSILRGDHSETIVLTEKQPEEPTYPYETGKGRFRAIARACGPDGYGQSYELPDGQAVFEGSVGYVSARQTRAEYRKEIAKAVKIVERVPAYKNRFGQLGERIVGIFHDEDGKEWAHIFWYNGKWFSYITAPSLEIAYELERENAYAY